MIQITDNEDYIWSLIAGALSGNISEKERLELDSWRQQSAEHESIFENAKRIWDETGKVNFTFDVDNAWIKTRLRIDDSYGSKGKKSKKLLVIYVAAASILLVIASTFFIGQLYQSTIRISTFQTTKKIV
ncbi:MAG: hypothetical protein N2662_11135, partial [Bacteroidales bacterium]|nr:hypothetical protein [Bacteroidales bacterium]